MASARQRSLVRNKFFWSIFVLILFLVCVPVLMLALISDSRAQVEETATIDTNSAIVAKGVAKQLYKDLMDGNSDQASTLSLSEAEVNGIIAMGRRVFPGMQGRVNITTLGVIGAFTLYLPNNPLGDYINLTIFIIPSSHGLLVEKVSLGSIEISGDLAISLVEFVLNRAIVGDAFGTKLVNAIDYVEVNNSKITLGYHSVPGLRTALENTRENFKEVRDELALLGDPDLVKLYYEHICGFHTHIDGLGQASVGYYLDTAFSFAEKRSRLTERPADENRAAILALSIFLGSTNFNSVIGALDKDTLAACQPRDAQMVLAYRNDLRLHFIFSAGLKIISDSGTSFALGEFKELIDTQKGGSGFSFADLAADRAGIRFAELALDEQGAVRVQQMAAELRDEDTFFPAIAGLPEGISQSEFDQRGGIESEYYQQHLASIIQRIDELPLYQTQ